MAFCSNCGSWVDKGAKICPKCGLNPEIRAEKKAKKEPIPYKLPKTKFSTKVFIDPLKAGFGNLKDNPSLLFIGLLMTFLSLVFQLFRDFFMENIVFSIPYWIVLFFISPFLGGGLLGVARDLFEGKEYQFKNFISEGKKNYRNLLLGGVLHFAILFLLIVGVVIITIVIGIVIAVVIGIFLMFLSLQDPASIVALLFILIYSISLILSVPLFVIASVFLSFYSIIIVADKLGVVESFKKSYYFARMNLGNVLGYTVVSTCLSLILSLLPAMTIFHLGGMNIGSVIIIPILFALMSGAFYSVLTFLYISQFYLSLTISQFYLSLTRRK